MKDNSTLTDKLDGEDYQAMDVLVKEIADKVASFGGKLGLFIIAFWSFSFTLDFNKYILAF